MPWEFPPGRASKAANLGENVFPAGDTIPLSLPDARPDRRSVDGKAKNAMPRRSPRSSTVAWEKPPKSGEEMADI
jgi:hypothetical protein